MGHGVLYWIFQRERFCCCLPVRVCVVITSLLGLLLAGLLAIVMWFEVATADALTDKERGAFIAGGIVETFFCLISAVGLIGVIVRKQSFVTAYAIGLYTHFVINLGVAGYYLYVVVHATHKDTVAACQRAIKNPQAQDQCASLFSTLRGVYIAFVVIILFLELYSAIVATRYVYQVRTQKRTSRMPSHARGSSDAGHLLPGFVRYKDASGATVYDSHYFPADATAAGAGAGTKEEEAARARRASTDSAELEGVAPLAKGGLYDPHDGGLPGSRYHEELELGGLRGVPRRG
ncbi:hypothetical protein BC834DRAFT_822911 [Gloeopeniophorella convolvens]|nr:hypothetical protein BC834DRAFT_822911 [Gloeopeniophorella convolvens]